LIEKEIVSGTFGSRRPQVQAEEREGITIGGIIALLNWKPWSPIALASSWTNY
jgi:hypothetical protein